MSREPIVRRDAAARLALSMSGVVQRRERTVSVVAHVEQDVVTQAQREGRRIERLGRSKLQCSVEPGTATTRPCIDRSAATPEKLVFERQGSAQELNLLAHV